MLDAKGGDQTSAKQKVKEQLKKVSEKAKALVAKNTGKPKASPEARYAYVQF